MRHKLFGAMKRPQLCTGGGAIPLPADKKPRTGLHSQAFREIARQAADRVLLTHKIKLPRG